MKNLITTIITTLIFSININAQFDKIETDDFNIVSFSFGHKFVLPHATRCAHSALNFHRDLFEYEPREKISVFIQDF